MTSSHRPLPVADRWFERRAISDQLTLLWEPHVIELMRCNIWHVQGRNRDLVIDTGMGVASLVDAMSDLVDKPVMAVATHGHGDHVGGHHEFDEVLAHPAESADVAQPELKSLHIRDEWGQAGIDGLTKSGYVVDSEYFVTALPAGVTLESFIQQEAVVTREIDEGDVIDLGDRHFEVLHLPGHSPGSIGLWDPSSATLFSGDAIYDGPLLDELPGSDIAAYCTTMKRLLELPVNVVHGGHDASFGRDRLREIARRYLDKRA